LGGSFDPIHHGHLIVAAEAARALDLAEVRFVPVREQPFKRGRLRASPEDRLAMLRLAVAGVAGFVADDRECRRLGPSYTVDTLRELRADLPGTTLCLLLGSDAAQDFPAWRDASDIQTIATVIILTRPGTPIPDWAVGVAQVPVPAIDISATGIRDRVRAGESIRYLVPEAVAAYIAERRLYVDEG